MTDWKRKLAAYLHDPPSKPFNLKEHHEIAETLLRELDMEPEELRWFFDKVCDHTAAAADRLAFPRSTLLRAEFRGEAETPFHHPLGGGTYAFENPAPSPTFAEENVHKALPVFLTRQKASSLL
jgi:CRISPR-associated protein Cmr2